MNHSQGTTASTPSGVIPTPPQQHHPPTAKQDPTASPLPPFTDAQLERLSAWLVYIRHATMCGTHNCRAFSGRCTTEGKALVRHMLGCANPQCTSNRHCTSAKMLLRHHHMCVNPRCLVCMPAHRMYQRMASHRARRTRDTVPHQVWCCVCGDVTAVAVMVMLSVTTPGSTPRLHPGGIARATTAAPATRHPCDCTAEYVCRGIPARAK